MVRDRGRLARRARYRTRLTGPPLCFPALLEYSSLQGASNGPAARVSALAPKKRFPAAAVSVHGAASSPGTVAAVARRRGRRSGGGRGRDLRRPGEPHGDGARGPPAGAGRVVEQRQLRRSARPERGYPGAAAAGCRGAGGARHRSLLPGAGGGGAERPDPAPGSGDRCVAPRAPQARVALSQRGRLRAGQGLLPQGPPLLRSGGPLSHRVAGAGLRRG